MKKLHYTLVLLSVSYALTAQEGINWVYGINHYTEGSHISASPDDGWLVSGYTAGPNNISYPIPVIGRYTSSGWEEFDLSTLIEYNSEVGEVSEVLYDPVLEQYYFIYTQGICDAGIYSELKSFGALGNWTASTEYDYPFDFLLCTVPGQGFIWSPQWSPQLIWQQGADDAVVLDYDWEETTEIRALQHWRAGTILVQTEQEISSFLFNENGVLLSNSYSPVSASSTIQAFKVLDDDRVVVVENDTLRMLNSALTTIAQIPLEGTGTSYLAVDEAFIYLLQELPTDGLHAFFLHHDLSEVGRTAIDLGDYELGDMDASDGRIALVGAQAFTDEIGGSEPINSQLFIRTYTATGPDLPDVHDLELVNLTVGTAFFDPYPFGPCGSTIVSDLVVEVRNNAPFPIDEVLLKFEYDPPPICPSICDPYVTQIKHHTGLNLQPGASISLPFETLWISGIVEVDEFELCINITAPNQPMEMDLANNSSCTSLLLIDANEPIPTPATLKLFPNPALDLLYFELPIGAKYFVVYDKLGRVVQQEQSPDISGVHQLDIRDLPTGLYHVQVQTEQGTHTGRFVKQ